MKTTTVAPTICSLEQNEVRNLFSIEEIPEKLRIVHLEGTPVRIELDSGGDGFGEIQKAINEEITIKNYDFSRLAKFFYRKGYLYGFVKDSQIKIYDVFVNENFLSSKDLSFLKNKFGVPIAEPLIDGKFSIKEIIFFLQNLKDIDLKNIYILPSVYIDDSRNGKNNTSTFYQTLFGVRTYTPYGYSGNYSQDYTSTTSNATFNGIGSLANEVKAEEEKKTNIPLVYTLAKKEERTSIYKETYKNVSERLKSQEKDPEVISWFKKRGKLFCYLYAIHTLPSTRNIIYDFAFSQDFNDDYSYIQNIEAFWAWIFLDFFDANFSDLLKSRNQKIKDDDFLMFELVFAEELKIFNSFFEQEENVSYNFLFDEKNKKESYV